MDDTLSILASLIWVLALGMWPVGFFFAGCSPCCDPCPWIISIDNCLRVAVVGSSTNEGWDCSVSSDVPGTNFTTSSDLVWSRSFSVHRLPASATIPVRLSLSATGSSRTPVGTTRTQTWRFTRASVSNQAIFDIIGPPWFLEIEVIVTGVATAEEAEVTATLGTDAHQQSRLLLNVKQGPQQVVYDTQVALTLVGLQRWLSLGEPARQATLVAGQSYSGWTVEKPTGISVSQHAFAVAFLQGRTICSAAPFRGRPAIQDRVVLDGVVAEQFLDGIGDIRVTIGQTNPSATTQVDLRMMPKNALCEITDMNIGVALGLYPEKIYATVPQSFFIDILGMSCGDNELTLRPLAGLGCAEQRWELSFYQRALIALYRDQLNARIADFWGGRTLLWNLEHGPHRDQFAKLIPTGASAPGPVVYEAQYKLVGSGHDEAAWSYMTAGCPPSMIRLGGTLPAGGGEQFTEGRNTVCVPDINPLFAIRAEIAITYNVLDGFDPCDMRNPQISQQSAVVSVTAPMTRLQAGIDFSKQPPQVRYSGVGNATVYLGDAGSEVCSSTEGLGDQLVNYSMTQVPVSLSATAGLPFPCGIKGTIVPDYSVSVSATPSQLFSASVKSGDSFQKSYPVSSQVLSIEVEKVPFESMRRFTCSPWSPEEIPAAGATLFRTCKLSDGSAVPAGITLNFRTRLDLIGGAENSAHVLEQTVPRSLAFAASPSYLPRKLFSNTNNRMLTGTPSVLQQPNCDLLRLIRAGRPSDQVTAQNPLEQIILSPDTPRAGECRYFSLIFGGRPRSPGLAGGQECDPIEVSRTPPSMETTVPCDNCNLVIDVVSGQENGRLTYYEHGDKKGLIEIVLLRDWLGGQGVTFTATCGSIRKTLRVRRQDTQPGQPTGLTATRNPCDTVTLTWIAPHDGGQPIINYTVQYRPLGTSNWITLVRPNSAETTAAVPGLLSVGYEFRVAAVTSVGSGAFSAVLTLGFALGPPTNLTATRGPCTAFALAWTPPQQTECIKFSGYRVEYRLRNEFAWTLFSTVAGTASSATVTGLVSDGSYQFRVIGQSAIGSTGASNIVDAWTVPQTPSGVVATAGDGQVTLQWSGAEDPCQPNTYRIFFRPTSSTSLLLFGEVSAPGMTFVVTGLSNGVEYVFSVQARNAAGFSGTSDLSNPVTPTA